MRTAHPYVDSDRSSAYPRASGLDGLSREALSGLAQAPEWVRCVLLADHMHEWVYRYVLGRGFC